MAASAGAGDGVPRCASMPVVAQAFSHRLPERFSQFPVIIAGSLPHGR